jgi:hypothetical protein
MTLVDRLPEPHATARSCLMAKRKVPFPDGGADYAHFYRTVTFPDVPTTTALSADFSSDAPLSLSLGYKRQPEGALLVEWTPRIG